MFRATTLFFVLTISSASYGANESIGVLNCKKEMVNLERKLAGFKTAIDTSNTVKLSELQMLAKESSFGLINNCAAIQLEKSDHETLGKASGSGVSLAVSIKHYLNWASQDKYQSTLVLQHIKQNYNEFINDIQAFNK